MPTSTLPPSQPTLLAPFAPLWPLLTHPRGRENPLPPSPPSFPVLPGSAQREPAGVDVHLGHPDELEGRGEAEGAHEREVTEEVGELVPLLQLVGGIVQHALVQVARLLDLQLVDVAAQPHQLPGQLLVLQAHFCLQQGEGTGFLAVNWLLDATATLAFVIN